MTDETPIDFFISYTGKDKAWAEWIASQLENNKYATIIQAWDFRPGNNFTAKMHEGLKAARRGIAVLSPDYLKSDFAASEWMAAFVNDPQGHERMLIPIRVAKCNIEGLLTGIVYADFLEHDKETYLSEEACIATLLSAVADGRQKPASPLAFPGGTPTSPPQQKEAKPPFPGSLPSNWQAPPRNSVFTGREAILESLHERLASESVAALNQIQAISGLGGVGNTQTAIEYAYRYGHHYQGGVFWVKADKEETLVSDFAVIAKLVVPSLARNDNEKLIVDAVKEWLCRNPDWLLVFDNVDDERLVKRFLPTKHNRHILITAWRQSLDHIGIRNPVTLDTMEVNEAVDFLFKQTGRDRNVHQEISARKLVEELGCLPLALEQAVGATKNA